MDNRIYGVHAVFEALASRRQPIERIHIAREAHSTKLRQIIDLARDRGIPVRREIRSVLDRMGEGQSHQGIIAVAAGVEYAPFEALFGAGTPLIVVLDGVEDPHNLGAVIRTAEACGASGIIVPERHSAPLSASVVKASAGASAYLPVTRVRNIVDTIGELKKRGVWVVGVDVAATQEWTSFDYRVPIALVLGGEHRGLRRLVREHCDVLVRLPMRGNVASLNISVAAAVVLYEVIRQRTAQK
jgi:23S rRNA (guanosine2251-2'-O)-methyltransferase